MFRPSRAVGQETVLALELAFPTVATFLTICPLPRAEEIDARWVLARPAPVQVGRMASTCRQHCQHTLVQQHLNVHQLHDHSFDFSCLACASRTIRSFRSACSLSALRLQLGPSTIQHGRFQPKGLSVMSECCTATCYLRSWSLWRLQSMIQHGKTQDDASSSWNGFCTSIHCMLRAESPMVKGTLALSNSSCAIPPSSFRSIESVKYS